MWDILGIAPTRDIKEIKSAYARLAKQYNPEEDPEAFKHIFDAYKAACIYAKGTEKNFLRKKCKKFEDNETKFISLPENSAITDTGEQKDISADNAANVTNAAQEFDFSMVNIEKNVCRKESASTEKYAFGSIDPNFGNLNGMDRTSSLRLYMIRRLRKIFDSRKEADIQTWQSFFYDTYFDELVLDADFRLQARDVFFHRYLPHLTAKLVAEKFGAGTQYIDEGYGRYTVIISDGRNVNDMYAPVDTPRKQSAPTRHRIVLRPNAPSPIAVAIMKASAIAFAALMIFAVISAVAKPSDSSYAENAASADIITLPPFKEGDNISEYIRVIAAVEEQTCDEDILYESCKGIWLFDFGYVKLYENFRAEMSFNGEIRDGTVSVSAAPEGAVLNMVFNCENETADGIKLTAHIISPEGKRLICTDRDGNEYTGVPEQIKEGFET